MYFQLLAFIFVIGANFQRVTCNIPKAEAAKQILEAVGNPKLYSKDIIPFQNKSGPLEVYSSAYIRSIDVDDVNMETIVDLTFRLKWKDHRLAYHIPGVTQVRFADISKFWIPDVFFRNSRKTEQMKSIYPEAYIEVSRKGDVLYSSRFIVNIYCDMTFERFPHDVHQCPIEIESYGYFKKDVSIFFENPDSVKFSKENERSRRFEIGNISAKHCISETSKGEYSCLKIFFTIDREFSAYLLEWYIPCICLAIIAFFSEFLEPAALLARLILTVGPLLTLMSASFKYSESLPSVAYSTCLDQFTGVSLTAIFATVLHALISYYFSLKSKEEGKIDPEGIPKWKTTYNKIKNKGNLITKALIIGTYFLYVFIYCLTYCL